MSVRIGQGIDYHILVEGEEFFLGGIKLDHHKGAKGHSDADVLLHAICDALLGALALGDIGKHFPDTDEAYKGIDSKILLEKTYALILEKGYKLVNLDSTVLLELPKIAPYIIEIRTCIAQILQIDIEAISVKATTTEKMGPVGAQEGVVAHAVCLLEKAV